MVIRRDYGIIMPLLVGKGLTVTIIKYMAGCLWVRKIDLTHLRRICWVGRVLRHVTSV